jgi:hypothetical protein
MRHKKAIPNRSFRIADVRDDGRGLSTLMLEAA